MSKGTYSFTTPIYYVNAAPHLGTAYTTIAADTVARYQRMNGYDVAFVTGMDEHGQKVADTAADKGMTPQDWCDSMEPAFRDAWDMLGITYTDFVRTTEPRHARTVQKFWQDLYDRGWCYKGSYEGWYCVHEETYYAESDLEKNEDGELVCPDCKRPVQKAGGEENWFFKLSEFGDKLLAFYEENPDFIRPETRKNEIVSFVKSGLKDLSISRSTFDWGVPLPFDEGHVAYVWADALLAYLTGIGYGDEGERAGEFDARWPMQYHFVGKDITRFHCVIWPAMLMAAGLPITHTVFGHGFLLTKGEKMSKSKGNALKPADLCRVFGVDAYRYYFMSDVQFGADGSISMERMVQVYNADLANTWGNLCSRVFNMTKKYFDGQVPEVPAEMLAKENPLRAITEELYAEYDAALGAVDFTAARGRRAEAGRPREPLRGGERPVEPREERGDRRRAGRGHLQRARGHPHHRAVHGAVHAEHVGRGVPSPVAGRRRGRDRHRGRDGLGPAARRQPGGNRRPPVPAPGHGRHRPVHGVERFRRPAGRRNGRRCGASSQAIFVRSEPRVPRYASPPRSRESRLRGRPSLALLDRRRLEQPASKNGRDHGRRQSAEPVFDDPQFRQKRKHGRYRVVDAPQLEGPVADTHAHLQLLPDPSYALARCAAHKVEFVCTIVDVFEDGTATFDRLNSWRFEAAAAAKRFVGWT